MTPPASDENALAKNSPNNLAKPRNTIPPDPSLPEMSADIQPGNPAPPPDSPSPSEPIAPLPREFGRYRLLKLLGGGGMGQVYLALDRKLDINVALKIPRPDVFAEPKMQARFYREARTAARLVHPSLCWVLDVGEFDATHYLVMRYVPGTPLSHCTDFSAIEAAAMVRDIARAMAAAHKEGVIHRDLKPSNIIVTPEGNPVVVDFGLALLMDDELSRISSTNERLGTVPYMAPEQLLGQSDEIGPRSDIYALGCILYKLLTGQRPFESSEAQYLAARHAIPPPPPSTQRPEIEPALDSICLKAIAGDPHHRYESMEELAAFLDNYIEERLDQPTLPARKHPPGAAIREAPSLVHENAIRFAFAAAGSPAPPAGTAPHRLFLGVGNDLRPGVIDQHQLHSYSTSTARLVMSNRLLVTASAAVNRDRAAPFTIVLPESPDFDCVVAAWLARELLTTGELPPGAEALVRYADKIDEGSIGHSLSNPFSPYAAYMQLVHRHARQGRRTGHELWETCVRQGLILISFSLERALRLAVALPSVDAFACTDVITESDRQDALADVERYHRKLADPATQARIAHLSLPGQFGGRVEVDTLLVRNVQNADDPDRCIFFKDWARSDRDRSPDGDGFIALSVFVSESRHEVRHCILSVTAGSGASLLGLAEMLDRAESKHRSNLFGADDRLVDPVTGSKKPPRAGYDNADPWYDGRAHGFTIVNAPRSGTLLTADEIESMFLGFGEII
jgi:serine/threonine protein kinase